MEPLILDLLKYTDPGVGVLAGRDRGEGVRKKVDLDGADKQARLVRVLIPVSVYAFNSSFFLGLFGESIVVLGADEFRRRYSFEGPDAERTRDDGIRMALLSGSPLSTKRPA